MARRGWRFSFYRICAIVLILCGFRFDGTVQAATVAKSEIPARQAVLLLVNRLRYEDLQQMPHLQQLADRGGVGVMNINTGGRRTDANEYGTLAAGVPTRLHAGDWLAYDANELSGGMAATDLYRELHGRQQVAGANSLQSVLLLAMPELLRHESQRQFAGHLGSIGDALHGAGLQTVVLGSEDTGERLWRPAVLLASDSQGHVDLGDVSRHLLTAAAERPFGVRTHYDKMWRSYEAVKQRAALVVLDLGDLYRLDAVRSQLSTSRYRSLRAMILQEIDTFAGRLLPDVQANRLLLVVTPQVAHDAVAQQEWLAPVLAVGGDVQPQSVLTSATTRRAGIISNLDIAPTVLRFLQISPPSQMIGYPLQGTQRLDPHRVGDLVQTTVWNSIHREAVLTLSGVWIGLGLLLALLRLVLCVEVPLRPLRAWLWGGLAMPLCLYLLPLFPMANVWEAAGACATLFLLFVAIPFRVLPFCRTLLGRLFWLAAATMASVLIDTWRGGRLGTVSMLSYDPIIGARYYGVGNEYMGVLVGSALLAFAALWQSERLQKRWLQTGGVVAAVLLTAFFALPSAGANTGGALTMAGTAALFALKQKRHSLRMTACVLLATLGGAGLLLFYLNEMTTTPSHIGAAARQVWNGGLPEALRILTRKSDLFLHAFRSSIWPSVLVAALGGFAWFLQTPLSQRAKWRQVYAANWTGIGAVVEGAVLGMLVNDTGVVVAAMMLLYAVYPALLIWLEVEQVHRALVEQFQPLEPWAMEPME